MSWSYSTVGDESSVVTKGTTPTSIGLSFTESGVPFLRVQNVNDKKILMDDTLYISEEVNQTLSRSIIQCNDVLISIAGTIGRSAVVPLDAPPMNCNQALAIVRLKDTVNPEFFCYWLESEDARRQITGKKVTATISNLSLTQIRGLKIPVPPLGEQKRIATILDKADSIKQSSDTTYKMRNQVVRSLFLEMFGDPANPETQWDRKPFGGLMECKNRIRVPVKKSERETTEGTHPYYGASGIVDYVDDYLFEGEHLLISEDGANLVARVTPIAFIATGQFWVNNHAHVFAENGNLDAVYCETLFSLLDLSTHITGSAQPKLNKGNLDNIIIPVPPLKIQKRFRQIIENISKIWSQVDERNSVLMDNSNSLIQELIA